MLGADDFTHSERVYVSDISPETLAQELRNGLKSIEFRKIVDTDSTVFIKPNLTDSNHNFGISATPLKIKMVVEAVSLLVKMLSLANLIVTTYFLQTRL
jgi:hypothetical protein